MTVKNAVYKVDNGVDFDELMFKTLASQVVQDSTHRFITDAYKSNLDRGNDLVKDVKHYNVSDTGNNVIILAGGIKLYLLEGWCGNNSSSITVFPSGLFTSILGTSSSTWVTDSKWETYETTADIKIEYITKNSVRVLNYGTKPISYELLVIGV